MGLASVCVTEAELQKGHHDRQRHWEQEDGVGTWALQRPLGGNRVRGRGRLQMLTDYSPPFVSPREVSPSPSLGFKGNQHLSPFVGVTPGFPSCAQTRARFATIR